MSKNRFHRFSLDSLHQNLEGRNLARRFALRYETLVNVFRGSGCPLPSTRSDRGNGLLSECLKDRRLIGHLNEVPSGGRREKRPFSMRIVPHDARTKEAVAVTYCEINWKDRGKEKEELNIPLVMQKK